MSAGYLGERYTFVPYVVAARGTDDIVIDSPITSTPNSKTPTPTPRPDLFAPSDMPSYAPSCHLHHPLDVCLEFQLGINRLPQPERLGKGH
jgi:hypothetical protein